MTITEHTTQEPYLISDIVGYRLAEQYIEDEVMKFIAYTETGERVLNHIQNRRTISQWNQNVEPTIYENLLEMEADEQRLIEQWRQDTKGDPDRGDTPDPETLKQRRR
ncbi:hypothetical protein NXS19_011291 [Fusarium pseudograminearum]|nr:hypothetical protein NXS19_011291 [Fusarium pseudograminearum]